MREKDGSIGFPMRVQISEKHGGVEKTAKAGEEIEWNRN